MARTAVRTLLILVVLGLATADAWVPHDPSTQRRDTSWSAPSWWPPSWAPPTWRPAVPASASPAGTRGATFLFGTDQLGRDIFSRFITGARASVLVAVLATALTMALALTIGIAAATTRGAFDWLLMAVADGAAAAPWVLVAIATRAALPAEPAPAALTASLVGVIGVASWPRPARHVRATVADLLSRDFVVAARASGASRRHIAQRHIAPHLWSLVGTRAAAVLPRALMAEVTLSALGFGVPEPTASWGTVVAEVQRTALSGAHWWTLLPLAGMIALLWLTSVAADTHIDSVDGRAAS